MQDEYVELSSRGFRRGRNGARRESMVKKDDDAIREKSWPAWILQYSAEDTIGWLPRKISTYQKVEKIGQGTYSTVYKVRARTTRNSPQLPSSAAGFCEGACGPASCETVFLCQFISLVGYLWGFGLRY